MKHKNFDKAMKKIKSEEDTKTVYATITEEEYYKLKSYLIKRKMNSKQWIKEVIKKL